MIAGRLEIRHETLDELEHGRSDATTFLRAALVEHGVLPARPERLERLRRWVEAQLQALPESEDRARVRSYASWKLLRDVARRAEHNDLNANAAGSARARLRSAIELTTWLHEQNRTLADLRQDLLEGWLLEGGSSGLAIAGFIEWLRKTKVITGLHVPRAPRPLKLNTVQDSTRWALLRRLLGDETLDLRERVAGGLLLLYAQPITKITRLRREHVILNDDDQVLIALGQEPIPLPAPLATLAIRLRDAPSPARDDRRDDDQPVAASRTQARPADHPARALTTPIRAGRPRRGRTHQRARPPPPHRPARRPGAADRHERSLRRALQRRAAHRLLALRGAASRGETGRQAAGHPNRQPSASVRMPPPRQVGRQKIIDALLVARLDAPASRPRDRTLLDWSPGCGGAAPAHPELPCR